MMHLLGTQIKVGYSRSVGEFIFELVDKHWVVSLHGSQSVTTRRADFLVRQDRPPRVRGVCNGDFFCSEFGIDIKHSSLTDGHLIRALVLDIDRTSGRNPRELDPECLSLHEVQLSLSCPAYRINATCHFKDHVGSLAVVVAGHSQEAGLGFSADHFSSKPFVIFLDRKETELWQEPGADWLDETLAAVGIGSFRMTRRHLRVGAGSENKVLVECDCENAERHRPPPNQRGENIQGIDAALSEAAAQGDEQMMSWLIGRGANANDQLGGLYGTLLLAACCHRNVRIVRLFLTSGADANAAARFTQPSLKLLDHEGGANVNTSVGPEGSPLQAAVRRRYDVVLMQLLFDHGADANGGSIYGTLLMAMFHQDHPLLDAAELLVRHGADINNTAALA
ncbi:hypothetical protein MFIFM68171_02129 [Madurella fahalii]|uniref:Uncharacterized protein n=1 Tax=Madurella fahalii TaxID=1157608 RepID=A0ABQ0G2H5_9PEZI